MKNHYQTLGLKNNAKQEEIKTAYRKLALKFHPDKNVGDSFFDEMFKEIKDAYDILSNPNLKRDYDLKYNAFLNRTIEKTQAGQQHKYNHNKEQTYRPKPKTQRSFHEIIKDFNLINLLKNKLEYYKKSTFKGKTWFIFQILILVLTVIGGYKHGFGGFFNVIGFYFFIDVFRNAIKRRTNLDFGLTLFGLVVSPIVAILLLGQFLTYFELNRLDSWYGNSFKVEKDVTYVKKNKFIANPYETGDSYEIYEENERQPEVQTTISNANKNTKYIVNQLENGDSPLDACFGKGIYAESAWLKFENSNRTDAIVCLVRVHDKKTIRNEYIRAGATFEMSNIPSGSYFIKVYYGNDWNPEKLNFCGNRGAFEKDISFSKSDKISDYIIIQNTSTSYTTGTITLYAVENGNMSTETINEQNFFEN